MLDGRSDPQGGVLARLPDRYRGQAGHRRVLDRAVRHSGAHGLRVVLVNAQSSQNVPGRKTDVPESQGWMKLHTYGLLGDSFRRPPAIEKVGTRWRLRDRPTQEASRSIQHRQKALTQRNVPLANVLSDISGVSGPAILAAILAGERDIGRWADLRDPGVPASREEVARSLEGNWREDVPV